MSNKQTNRSTHGHFQWILHWEFLARKCKREKKKLRRIFFLRSAQSTIMIAKSFKNSQAIYIYMRNCIQYLFRQNNTKYMQHITKECVVCILYGCMVTFCLLFLARARLDISIVCEWRTLARARAQQFQKSYKIKVHCAMRNEIKLPEWTKIFIKTTTPPRTVNIVTSSNRPG